MKTKFLNKINEMKQDIIKEVNDNIHLFTEYKVGDILVHVRHGWNFEVVEIRPDINLNSKNIDVSLSYKIKNLHNNLFSYCVIHQGLVPKYDYDNKTERYVKALGLYSQGCP